MKALLRKDFYLLKSYCKSYVLICAVFLGVCLVGGGNLFFIAYPAMLCSLIPVTLLTYDERSRWTEYCACLPFTRAQMVSGKYLTGLLCSAVVWTLSAAILWVLPGLDMDARLFLMAVILCLSLVSPAVCLPFVFRYGTEKGRIAYYLAIGLFCALSYALMDSAGLEAGDIGTLSGTAGSLLPGLGIACLICAGLYAASWVLSIRFFEKKALG